MCVRGSARVVSVCIVNVLYVCCGDAVVIRCLTRRRRRRRHRLPSSSFIVRRL